MVAVPEVNLHAVPDSISDEEAVFIEPLAAAYQVLAQCRLDPRSNVAVVGTGRLGLLIVQVLAQTGCRLTAIGRNRMKLDLCEKKGVQAVHVDHVTPKSDRDVVVECTGSPAGMDLALRLVRPRGVIVLKSTYAGERGPNLAPAVVNEVTIIGSRCGPFREAIQALERQAVDVRSLISRSFPLDQAPAAFAAARDPANVKILLRNAR
jgi:threonine dehydrogenase-like Zn-dependent dehydrogenase